ncbi:MAG: hypothetical protein E7K64_06990, partial [Clostridia bacterium]|nr:hypothetical protein [Clostridia bacterium]
SRLALMSRHADGFAIAEADLALRGPGELLGLRQSGAGVFRLADPVQDYALIPKARDIAERMGQAEEVPPLLAYYMADMRKRLIP